ncbi:MAG: nitroreductase family protein [Acidimicrobiales bacterium]
MALVNAAGASVDTSERAAQELLQLMRQRHSARMAFDPLRKIPPDHLRLVLEAARWAPTAHNMQNYEVIVVDDVDRLGEIAAIRSEVSLVFIRENFEQLSFSEDELSRKKTGILARAFPPSWLTPDPNPFEMADLEHSFLGHAIQSAPVLLIVLHDSTRRAPASEGDVLGMMSLGCVMENMWLMAQSLGISMQILSAMSGDAVEDALRHLLGVPKSIRIGFGARLGYPPGSASSTLRVRRDVEDFVHRNSFSRATR